MINQVIDGLSSNGEDANHEIEASVKTRVIELCGRFPIYGQ